MRTTLDIDEDVLLAIKDRAKREHTSAGRVVSDLARQALTSTPPGSEREPARHGFRPLPHRGGTVTNELIDRLREEDAD